jgi:hypothetical protein
MLCRVSALALTACLLAPAPALADYPHGPGLAPVESPRFDPVEVCNQMIRAEKDGRYDDLIARTSCYARARLTSWDRFLLKLARSRLSESRCVRITEQSDPDHVMVLIYAPNGHSAPMPFVREEGVWRFDQKRWEALRHQGKAPKA